MNSKSHRKFHIGIVGAGSIVKSRHLPNLLKIHDVELTAVSNSTYESSERFCQEHLPQATPIKNWVDLVSLPDLDIVWIGTHPYMHSSITISALEAGKHVFCQARMSMNVHDAREMLAAAQRYPHLVTMLCPPPMGMTGDLVMKKLLAEGAIGTPHSLRLHSLNAGYSDPEAPPHWRQRSELSGFNVLSFGIYVEVLQRWLGPIQEVRARGHVVHPVRHGYEVRIPDFLQILATFESGLEGELSFSGVAPHAPGDRVEIYGTTGTLVYDFSQDRILMGGLDDSELEEVEIPDDLRQDWRVEEDFINAVKSHGGVRPSPSFEEGVAYMHVVHAVADSVRSGDPVKTSDAGQLFGASEEDSGW